MRNKQNLIILDKQALLKPLYPKISECFDIHLVHSLREIFQRLEIFQTDTIIIAENFVTESTVDLALELKQSILAKDLPILVMASQPSIHQHATYLHYCGISFLDIAGANANLLEKITELQNRYNAAKQFQEKLQTSIQSYKLAINARIDTVCTPSVNSYKKNESFTLLLFQLNLRKVKSTMPYRNQVNQDYLDSIIHHCIAQFINEDTDYLVPAEPGRFYVITGMVDPLHVALLAERINDLLYFTTKSDTTRMSLEDSALHVGIVTASCKDSTARKTLFDVAEVALEHAQQNSSLYYRA